MLFGFQRHLIVILTWPSLSHSSTTIIHAFSAQSEMPQIDNIHSDTDCDQDLFKWSRTM